MASRLLAVCGLMQAWGHLLRGWALPGSPKVQGRLSAAFVLLPSEPFLCHQQPPLPPVKRKMSEGERGEEGVLL